MKHYYVPSTKTDLIKWLNVYYCNVNPKFKKMSKKQLYAIFYKVREAYA